MKILAALFVAAFCLHSQAESPINNMLVDLEIVSIDEDSPVYSPSATNAQIEVNLVSMEMTLTVFQSMPLCEDLCILVMPSPLTITLSLEAIEADECGTMTYIAEKDQTASNGLAETLVLVDNTHSQCSASVEYEVTLKSFNPLTQIDAEALFVGNSQIHLPVLPLDSY